ncbi:protein FRIGIDA-ESSENTIAL 1-like isoform X1 [Hibiscus syriacus]|uniref:protein FRIGIDA-ESSENTIAL 1-like isoform X1 n=1 Tax=Hibiscus syriacus TaxID=106335 RepID=UPI001922E87C|nr:protein FRIGIDA-ESSENTIAL 1-like isoform X1 [Hibiscus syriacus]
MTPLKIPQTAAMHLSTPAAVPLAVKDVKSSDMEIDGDEVEEGGKEELHVSFKRNGASNNMKSKEHDGHPGSDPLRAPGSLPDEPLATQREDLRRNYEGFKYPISGKNAAKEKAIQEYDVNRQEAQVILERKAPEKCHGQHTNSKSHLVVNEIVNETTNRSSVDSKKVAINEVISIPVRYQSGAGASTHLGLKRNNKQMCMQTEDDKWSIKLRFYRSASPQTSPGCLSPGNEFNSENKRTALICDFFVKGWCIKGSSCKYIHTKGSGINPRQQPEEDVAVADEKAAVQLDEGIGNAAERSRSPSPHSDRLHSSVRNKTALSPLLQSKDKSIGTSLGSQQFLAVIDDFGPSKDVRKNSTDQNLPTDNYVRPCLLSDRGSSTFRNSFLPKHIASSSGSVTSLGNTYKEEQKFRVWTWLASLPLCSSQSACSLGAQKMLDNNREHHSSPLSLLQGSSPFSNFELENCPVSDIASDPLHFAEYRIKFSSEDWEPSVPFRPSFFVTFGPSSPRRQYDPFRDSIDLSNVGKGSLKFSFCSQYPSLLNLAYPPTYGDSESAGPLVPECNVDKRTVSSHARHLENLVNNNCYTSGKHSTTDEGTSAADMQNGLLAKEEISSVASHVKDVSKTRKFDTGCDARHQRDGFGCKKDLKVDRDREKNETDIEHKADGDALRESKATRHFHTALVDLIKEILKPTWHEGHLSKDVHNRIVKKAADKVIGTIQSHQIPFTFESTEQYLSSSQPKIARLVQGYIEKYRKS